MKILTSCLLAGTILSDVVASEVTLWSLPLEQASSHQGAKQAGMLLRRQDGALLNVQAGDQLAPGVYAYVEGMSEQSLLAVGQWGPASSLVDLPTLRRVDASVQSNETDSQLASLVDRRRQLAMSLQAVDQWSMIIAAWRLEDQQPWPWLGLEGGLRSLPWLCERVNREPWRFERDLGYYVDDHGKPISVWHEGNDSPDSNNRSEPSVLAPGDLLTASEGRDQALIMIMIADQGLHGQLDPADLVLTAQLNNGELADQLSIQTLGEVAQLDAQPDILLAYRRDEQRRLKLSKHLPENEGKPKTLYGILITLPRHRQWMVVAALAVGSLLLLRSVRRYRRKK